jgi:hypothetical protein
MTGMEYLLDRVTRAERLAKHALDVLTVNRLASFAAECREEPKGQDRATATATRDSAGLPESRNDLCVHGEER